MEKDLITYEGWDTNDTMDFSFHDAVFKKDFGVFQEGERFDSVSFNYEDGHIAGWNFSAPGTSSEPDKRQKIALVAVEE